MASETDYAWAAGIIDGEGAILMTRNAPGTNRRKTLSFQVRISVRMTHNETIRRLGRIFGGTIKGAKARDPKRHRPTLDWYVGDLLTVDVLTKVLPYLTTKREQADLVLEFRQRCFPKLPGGRGATCPDDLVKLRRKYFERLRELNRKGPQP